MEVVRERFVWEINFCEVLLEYLKNCFWVLGEICKYCEVFESILSCLSLIEDFDNNLGKILENSIFREIDLLDSYEEDEDINGNDWNGKIFDSGIGLWNFLFYYENDVYEKGMLWEENFLGGIF